MTIGEIIHAHQAEIRKRWMDQSRQTASAKGLDRAALESMTPRLLPAMADEIAAKPHAPARRRMLLHRHVAARIRQGYDLAEILVEVVELGRAISKAWNDLPASDWPSPLEIEALHDVLNSMIADATEKFECHMLEDEQTEKRYLRRLHQIANEALHDITQPLHERLREPLEVIMEAMDAQCAAMLGYSMAAQELVLVACAGDEVLEPYATSVDASSFVARVAHSEDPTMVFDAKATSLDIPTDLRSNGIHALLGVRLPLHSDLLGVLYIGVDQARTFSDREIARIEALAERFAQQLEHARLFSELADKVRALHIEHALRERFVATLVHDLRVPLSIVRLAADAIHGAPSRIDETQQLAQKIMMHVERADRMIRDLLDANRIRAGEPLPLKLAETDAVALANEVITEARAMYGDRFILDTPTTVRGFWSQDELRRALWNLVTNAVKYGARRRPITITIERTSVTARISVHNEGDPIPYAARRHLFDAYARGPSTSAGPRQGWGLGLTLVRDCAEAHGGRVDLVSDKAGTTFTIELPLDARPDFAPQPRKPASPSTQRQPGATSRLT